MAGPGWRSSRPGPSDRMPGTLFGPVPRVLWGGLVTDEIDHEHRLLQALNCLLVETPAGRVLVETGIGERVDDKTRAMRVYEGPPGRAGAGGGRFRTRDRRRRGHEPPAFRPRRRACCERTARAPSRAQPIVAQKAEWEVALGDNPRARRLVRAAGAASSSTTGAPRAGPRVSASSCPASRSCRRAATPRATRPSSSGAPATGARRPWRSSATCSCGRGAPTRAGSRRSMTSRSIRCMRKLELFAQAVDEGWLIVLSHESKRPVGRLERDRDRFRFEPV